MAAAALAPEIVVELRAGRPIGAAKLTAWGFSAVADDAQLLIGELVTNAFRHAIGHQILFRLLIGVDVIVLEVDDGSPGRPVVRDAGPEEENGRGMFLVNALAAPWGTSAGGTRTWCALTIPHGDGRSG